jgi:hypothetical protein
MQILDATLKAFQLGAGAVCDKYDSNNTGYLYDIEQTQRFGLRKVI